MGEQPLFTCKAHVFQLEPEQKKTWIALSTTSVSVQIFHDPIKNIYRIVSVEGTKALINSIVTPRMTFTKTSQKFGQWIDFKLNLVYGLGFANDVELNRFVDKFREIKELTRSASTSSSTTAILRPHERSNSCEISSMSRNIANGVVINGHSHQNHHMHHHHHSNSNGNSNNNSGNSGELNEGGGSGVDTVAAAITSAHLKSENDRLRLVLAHSSASARKLDEELTRERANNERLARTLEESHANVADWKQQLHYYKEECARMRLASNSSSNMSNGGGGGGDSHDFNNEVTSSSNTAVAFSHSKATSNAKLKQELLRLSDKFDSKLAELVEIRTELQRVISELL